MVQVQITAKIRPADDKGKSLWMFINNEGDDQASDVGTIDLDAAGKTAWPILPEEVLAIKLACEEWLEEESQRWMMESSEEDNGSSS